MSDGGNQHTVLTEDVTERQPAAVADGVTREVVQMPLVAAHGPMEPDRVIEARALEVALTVGTTRDVGMRAHHGIGGEIVAEIRQCAQMQHS